MAITQGLWNVGGVNIPDFGISEALGIGQNNLAQTQTPSIGPESTMGQAVQSSPNVGPTYYGPQNTPTTQTQDPIQQTGGAVQGASTTQSPQLPQGPSDQELNQAYDPIFNYLNQAESSLRGAYPGVQTDIGNQFNTSKSTLDTGKSQGLTSLDTNAQGVQQTKEDAMSSARRLYNELIQGYGQRFGGSTSAGEASRALAGTEAQRTMGGVNRDYGNSIAAINNKKVEVEQNYQNGLLQIQQTRDSALNQANRDFQQKLLDIQQSRASTESEKAQQKMAALQELRNQAYNIQLENQQFQQQLVLQRQSDTSQLAEYVRLLDQSTGSGEDTQTGFKPEISSNLQTGGSSVSPGSALTGQIGKDDELVGQTSGQRLYDSIFG